jgi:hypothetical protein
LQALKTIFFFEEITLITDRIAFSVLLTKYLFSENQIIEGICLRNRDHCTLNETEVSLSKSELESISKMAALGYQ